MIDNEKFKELRAKAESRLAKIADNLENVSDQSMERLLHELSVHQIELEMQNDELRKSYHIQNESRNLFHKLYKNAPVAYIIVNNYGQIGMANDKFYETVNIPQTEDLKRRSLTDFIHYEDINLFYSMFKTFYANPDTHKFEIRFVRDHTAVHTVITGYKYQEALNIYKDMQGYDLLITINDVTKIKQLEDELNRKNKALEMINETLQKRVEYETGQRLKHEQMLFEQKKFADMGEMLSSIAHQWRQPLNVLGLVLQSVEASCCEGDCKDVKELTSTGFEVITYLSETISDFKNFFKPEKEKQAFNVSYSVYSALKLVNKQIEESGIQLTYKCSCRQKAFEPCEMDAIPECVHETANLIGYENEFKQVILNLLYNARDAVIENCKHGEGIIEIGVSNRDDELSISISDNGGGITEEIGKKIYDPYFTTKQEMNGTGIGLYMCKTIIEKHFAGSLSHINNDGGVVFTISFAKTNPDILRMSQEL